jgi:hypothetical protein
LKFPIRLRSFIGQDALRAWAIARQNDIPDIGSFPMSGICFTNCQSSRLERLVRLQVSGRRRIAMRMRLGPCNRGCAITRRDELDQVIGELIGGWGTETSCGIPARSGIETQHCYGVIAAVVLDIVWEQGGAFWPNS